METVFKVVRKDNRKLTSCSVEEKSLIVNYKYPVVSRDGLFVFQNPYWAKKFASDYKHFRIIKGITSKILSLDWCLDKVTIEEHKIFWDFYFKNKKLPNNVDMMKINLYPYRAPWGTFVCFDFKMTNRFVDINYEIDKFEGEM